MVSDWQPTLFSATPKPLHVALGDHVLPLLSILPPQKSESYIAIDYSLICMHGMLLSHVSLFCGPLDCSLPGSSVEFSREEYWSGLPFPPPGDLPDPEEMRVEPTFPALTGGFFFF